MSVEEPYLHREYRTVIEPGVLSRYRVVMGESDLFICTETDLEKEAFKSLTTCRDDLKRYIESHPSFGTSFSPCPVASSAPDIVEEMASASAVFDVGPMASVAGAVAGHVGTDLLGYSRQVIVENGGDLFLAGGGERKVRVLAGKASSSIDIIIKDSPEGVGLCTSSARVGPSVSLGAADAVAVLAPTAGLADAAATAFCNRVHSAEDVEPVLEMASGFEQVLGVVIVAGGSIGVWGQVQIA